MRIGVDLGGTKIEALALDDAGVELARHRIATPRNYEETIAAIVSLVQQLESQTARQGSVGMGIPGTIRPATGTVKNANSTWLNGRPLEADLSRALAREVRVANDANCLAVSEATDGAGKDARVVFAVILGTGCGGGIALAGGIHAGPNGVAGEWGHSPLPWPDADESPGPQCYCGRRGCMETWVSGPALARDFAETSGRGLTTHEIVADSAAGDADALAALARFEDRLARGLAQVVHVLDPDVFVFGGGLSRIDRIYANLPGLVRQYTFGGDFTTPLVPAEFGDSSGVRGAAWLWPAMR